jgi:hypothetical protein
MEAIVVRAHKGTLAAAKRWASSSVVSALAPSSSPAYEATIEDAPDTRCSEPKLPPVFWGFFYVGCFVLVAGVAAMGELFGPAGAVAAVFVLFVLYIWQQSRAPIYFDDGNVFMLGGDKALPPPGKRALQAPAARQISRSQRPALPGPEK